jgi:hypothetical protein
MTQVNTFKSDKAYKIENLNRNLIFKADVIRQSLNKTDDDNFEFPINKYKHSPILF